MWCIPERIPNFYTNHSTTEYAGSEFAEQHRFNEAIGVCLIFLSTDSSIVRELVKSETRKIEEIERKQMIA